MPIINSNYNPVLFLKNGHLNTIFTSFFRKPIPVSFVRERIITNDKDFLDIDFLKAGNHKIVILCHGLEGNSSSKYIQGTSGILHSNNFDIAAMNYRYCSGEINNNLRTYHSGETEDLHTVINYLLPNYNEIFLVGFSLGGNIVLKYAGDRIYTISPKVKAIVGVSTPIDLYGSSIKLTKFKNKLYTKRFLKTLLVKAKIKQKLYPSHIDLNKLNTVREIIDFDNHYTSVVHGFLNARDYYNKCNSKQFLQNIKTPTLIINALDDPFLSDACYPIEEVKNNNFLNLMIPKHGGHLGFFQPKSKYLWNEIQILSFIKRH